MAVGGHKRAGVRGQDGGRMMAIKTVADTVAGAVRLAVADDLGDFWRNRIEAGSLKTAMVRNSMNSGFMEQWNDDSVMRRGVVFGMRA